MRATIYRYWFTDYKTGGKDRRLVEPHTSRASTCGAISLDDVRAEGM